MAQARRAQHAMGRRAPKISLQQARRHHIRPVKTADDLYAAATRQERNRHGTLYRVAAAARYEIECDPGKLQSAIGGPLLAKNKKDRHHRDTEAPRRERSFSHEFTRTNTNGR